MNERVNNEVSEKDRSNLVGGIAFESMDKDFARAEAAKPQMVTELSYTLAGREVRMQVVGLKLAERINLPFAHLRVDDNGLNTSRLSILLWDESETGIRCRIASRSDGFELKPVFFQSADGRFIFQQLQCSAICFDRAAGWMIVCTTDAERLSLYERGRPLHVPLSVWHNDQDVPIIHSGLVSKDGRGVLFAGSAGAGKSTSALVCAHYGFGYVSDDLIGLETLQDGSFTGYSLYNSTFLEKNHLERFDSLRRYALKSRYDCEDKLLVLLSQVSSIKLERSAPIRAIVLPRVVPERHSEIHPAAKGQALLALMPSFQVGRFGSTAEGFEKLSHLTQSLPCYRLDIGGDFAEIPRRVEDMLDGL